MRQGAWNVLIGAAATVVVIAGLRAAATILIPIVIAILLAIVILPVVTWLRERGIPSGIAVAGSMLVTLAALAGPTGIVVTVARQFVARVPEYRVAVSELSVRFSVWLGDYGLPSVTSVADPNVLLDWMTFAATGTATLLTRGLLVLLVTAFILLETAEFRPKLQAAFGMSEDALARFRAGTQHVYQFLWIKTVISAATGLAAALWTTALGIEFALLWGLAAFLLNYIPNFGSLIAAVPPVMLALLDGGVGWAVLVAAGYVVINISLGTILEPRLIGRRLGLSPLALVVSLLFWGWVWGPVGLLLAVPLTMAVRLVLGEFEQARWLAVLIAKAPPPVRAR
jgi:predicted PurR-regulated permease PerM